LLISLFRNTSELNIKDSEVLHLKPKEEFPTKEEILIEDLISSEKAEHFLKSLVAC
jgi:hypothetical protein